MYGRIGEWILTLSAPLNAAETLLEEAKNSGGIATIEKALGIPEGGWKSANNAGIYRFIVNNPKKFDLRLPKGTDSGAYQKEWVLGGRTLGGASEAVIKAMSLEDLKSNVENAGKSKSTECNLGYLIKKKRWEQ